MSGIAKCVIYNKVGQNVITKCIMCYNCDSYYKVRLTEVGINSFMTEVPKI